MSTDKHCFNSRQQMNEKQKMLKFQRRRVLQYTADYCSGVHCIKIALWGRVLYLWESALYYGAMLCIMWVLVLYHVGACSICRRLCVDSTTQLPPPLNPPVSFAICCIVLNFTCFHCNLLLLDSTALSFLPCAFDVEIEITLYLTRLHTHCTLEIGESTPPNTQLIQSVCQTTHPKQSYVNTS